MTSNYGDTENVKRDARTVRDIIGRQGLSFVIDCIAEFIGETANKLSISNEERKHLMTINLNEMKEAILERI